VRMKDASGSMTGVAVAAAAAGCDVIVSTQLLASSTGRMYARRAYWYEPAVLVPLRPLRCLVHRFQFISEERREFRGRTPRSAGRDDKLSHVVETDPTNARLIADALWDITAVTVRPALGRHGTEKVTIHKGVGWGRTHFYRLSYTCAK